jgi:hypothetical protein
VNDIKPPPSGILLRSFLRWHFKSGRLEDRIHGLCAKAVATSEPAELNAILGQLTTAHHENVERIRKRVAEPRISPERRFSRT